MRYLVIPLSALLLAAGCTKTASLGSHRASHEDPATVVATLNGASITLADVDKPVEGQLQALEKEVMEKKHELRKSALERLIVERLLEAEAARRGVSTEDMLAEEIESKVERPDEAEIRAFYEMSAGTPGLPPFDEAKERIAEYLVADSQRRLAQTFFAELRAGATVETFLPEPELPAVEVEAKGPSKGPESAPITVVIFSDFECPYCDRANAALDQVAEAYGDKVRFVFRDFPLSFHPNAHKAAEAGHCADEQGKFWALHDKMFENQRALGEESLKGYARDVGLDGDRFDNCLDTGKMAEKVIENMQAGEAVGVRGTPAFFVNGRMLAGALPFEEFQKVIDKELAKR